MKRRIVDEEMKKKMKELEGLGYTRSEIADRLDLEPSTVTKHLGPVRPYKYFRMKIA